MPDLEEFHANCSSTDNAIFTAQLSANTGPKIAGAVLPAGLPESSLGQFIGALTSQNQTALAAVPGVNGRIISAGVGGLFDAYTLGFRFVWVAAGCFAVIAVICKFFHFLPSTLSSRFIADEYL